MMSKIGSEKPDYPTVSVAMATYNGERYLEEQLDSILSQTLKPVEIIVCDDQSTDGTRAILEKYQQDGHIRFFINDNRLGFVGNFKKAVSLTKPNNYIALSDQDDIWLPNKIDAAANLILNIEVKGQSAMVYSDLVLVDQDKNILNSSFRNELGQDVYRHCLATLLFGGFVNGCTMLMNPLMRTYFATIPDRPEINHDTWIALIAYTFGHAGIVEKPDIFYRKHLNNASEVHNFKRKNRLQRLKGEVLNAFSKNDLFKNEISTAEAFYHTFHENFSIEDKVLIQNFIQLQGKTYLRKKIALRTFFKNNWI
jgi:glycosyltransferase involved in cell wall biosynthesis